MKKNISLFLLILLFSGKALAEWPRTINTSSGGKIIIYQPQPEKLKGDVLSGRAAISIRGKSTDEPIFGVFWFDAKILTNRDTRMASLQSLKIKGVRLPDIDDSVKIAQYSKHLETEAIKWNLEISLDDVIATIELETGGPSIELENDLSKIVYATTPSTLVLIDGDPKLQNDEQLKIQKVVNSPFLILQSPENKKYYLSAGNYWCVSTTITEGWIDTKQLPKSILDIDKQLKAEMKSNQSIDNSTPRSIIISTTPAELIQSNGEANFAAIQGTGLLYMTNSENDIFMDINLQKYFVLISGRWYSSSALKGPWSFVASNKLPADFKKIPEGSEKDNVLSSVPGTSEANEAVMDAQIPQTAKVDRTKATCTVSYDGEPKFEKIEGTSLLLAVNTNSTVLQSGKKYYCVENGVWFESTAALGHWTVSEDRPSDVDKIPASSPAYNIQYVYIYDVTPQYVYVGYTPGYMGCYVYGGVVVYGTGYYYNPWYGAYYYPRPVTYGFNMHYNPWTGWSMGFHYSSGYFHVHGGYWGPPIYRPPYHPPHHGGYYGRNNVNIHGDVNINVDRSNNIYNNRKDVTTMDVKRGDAGRTKSKPNTNDSKVNGKDKQPISTNSQKPTNNVISDKDGNIYQQKDDGSLQRRNNNTWQDADKSNQTSLNQVNQQQQKRERAQMRNNNFGHNQF